MNRREFIGLLGGGTGPLCYGGTGPLCYNVSVRFDGAQSSIFDRSNGEALIGPKLAVIWEKPTCRITTSPSRDLKEAGASGVMLVAEGERTIGTIPFRICSQNGLS